MPTYTYQCDAGHKWDEVRTYEGSQTSSEPCPTCLAYADERGLELGEDLSDFAGRKVPAQVSIAFHGHGWTPTFYPGRKGNK